MVKPLILTSQDFKFNLIIKLSVLLVKNSTIEESLRHVKLLQLKMKD